MFPYTEPYCWKFFLTCKILRNLHKGWAYAMSFGTFQNIDALNFKRIVKAFFSLRIADIQF